MIAQRFRGLFRRRDARAVLGRRGERRAARFLRRRGYRILHRNHRLGRDEADLVAVAPDGSTIVVVEVKTRSGPDRPLEESVDRRKRDRLVRLACRLRRSPRYAGRPLRFDVVTVTWPPGEGPVVRHYENAFEVGWS